MDRDAFMQHNLDYSLEFGSIRNLCLIFVGGYALLRHDCELIAAALPCFVNIWKIEHISNFYFQDRSGLPSLTLSDEEATLRAGLRRFSSNWLLQKPAGASLWSSKRETKCRVFELG